MKPIQHRLDRSPGPSYAEILSGDRVAPYRSLLVDAPGEYGRDEIEVERYTTRRFHELEKQHVWRAAWQFACREEHVPEVGDTYLYEICDLSFLIVRAGPDDIRCYWNVCRHRGRILVSEPQQVSVLRCPFHGFTWNLDGSLAHLPSAWDFPHADPNQLGLAPVQVGRWGGFVFINPDLGAGPLQDHLGIVIDDFTRWRFEDRYVEAHVAKLYDANWKVVQEAFMESLHVAATHPQQLVRLGDTNSQHDCFDQVNRSMHPSGTPSPLLSCRPTEQEMLDSMLDVRLDEPSPILLPEGTSLRQFSAGLSRDEGPRVSTISRDSFCRSTKRAGFGISTTCSTTTSFPMPARSEQHEAVPDPSGSTHGRVAHDHPARRR
jgi:phenylpropionate dioxygenase-like ring-hydroxylating dioxygenase large terminal subunit